MPNCCRTSAALGEGQPAGTIKTAAACSQPSDWLVDSLIMSENPMRSVLWCCGGSPGVQAGPGTWDYDRFQNRQSRLQTSANQRAAFRIAGCRGGQRARTRLDLEGDPVDTTSP
jgi:hypothetical protein